MIRYDLSCKEGHRFDGWFASSAAFEAQRDAGQVQCAICGSHKVDRALMSPGVPTKSNRLSEGEKTPLEQLREHVEANSDYVGLRFADEARAMHEGRSDPRAIHGEAKPEEARALIEEGVPIAPLPFIPKRQTN
ncbi:MAG TPA: DUF1178 family protein [Paracoccus sp. (in: a-proteobacteria)]|uniref:DUF1178 family protein n=1 Tax=uncultured Paracoccus sp. TaxID=189685 RepID=UPI002621CAD2|nr:DUF1178 family protein [uncultured Paracoccus sp.]HMQ41709.1 DUF1178 family protein [Paracoccus sp. (in: a-proteobacteria)]HMR35969.1 DUF1178 family protein [Paracoccus sp. (in: a-proteobacteria)]